MDGDPVGRPLGRRYQDDRRVAAAPSCVGFVPVGREGQVQVDAVFVTYACEDRGDSGGEGDRDGGRLTGTERTASGDSSGAVAPIERCGRLREPGIHLSIPPALSTK